MSYFAGPIVLSPSQTADILSFLAVLLLLALGLVTLFAWSIIKTVKHNQKQATRSNPGNKLRTILTIILPIITVISFVVWLLASMATKEDRYLDPGSFSISTVLSTVTIGLFAISMCSALYYLLKK
jgi:nitric oxide reductase large subunit